MKFQYGTLAFEELFIHIQRKKWVWTNLAWGELLPKFAGHIVSGLVNFAESVADQNGLPPTMESQLELAISGAGLSRTVTHRLDIAGPGAVAHVPKELIERRDPIEGTAGFERVNFPLVEFSEAGLPWRYSPCKPNANGALAPWLVLVVVPIGEETTFSAGSNGNGILSINVDAGKQLPDPQRAWLWAHVQMEDDGAPELARLICPIRLEPTTKYRAALVPLYEAGRRSGLGIAQEESQPLLAWTLDSGSVTLPTYDSWTFTTGEEDFETLARRLFPAPPDPRTGLRTLDLSKPGLGYSSKDLGIGRVEKGAALHDFRGGLTAVRPGKSPWGGNHKEALQAKLMSSLTDGETAGRAKQNYDPLVDDKPLGPPLYGHWQNQDSTPEAGWMGQINLDPALRAAAGMGARSFRRDEEKHMADAWRQLGDFRKATQKARRTRFALAVNGRVSQRIRQLPVQAKVQITRPVQKAVLSKRVSTVKLKPIAQFEIESKAVLEPSFVRLATKLDRKIVSGQNAKAQGAARSKATYSMLGTATKVINGTISGDALACKMIPSNKAIDYEISIANAQGNSTSSTSSSSTARSQPVTRRSRSGGFRAKVQSGFRKDIQGSEALTLDKAKLKFQPGKFTGEIVGKIERAAPTPPKAKPQSEREASMRTLSTAIDGLLETTPTILRKFQSEVGGVAPQSKALVPIPAVPSAEIRFDIAAVGEIEKKAPGALVPGANDLPLNGVALVKSNPDFVGAFLLGMNHEASREFAWRQLSADLSQTWFRRFWDYIDGRDDIGAVKDWTARSTLNKNLANGEADSVLLLRTELLRRFPETQIYAVPAAWDSATSAPIVTAEQFKQAETPMFDGRLGETIRYVGFDIKPRTMVGTGKAAEPGWFVVFEQPQFAPRFGIDNNDGTFRPNKLPARSDNIHWGNFAKNEADLSAIRFAPAKSAWSSETISGFTWDRSSADMAGLTWQRPVRLLIHASRLVEL